MWVWFSDLCRERERERRESGDRIYSRGMCVGAGCTVAGPIGVGRLLMA